MARLSLAQQRDDEKYGFRRPGVSVPQPDTASEGIAGRSAVHGTDARRGFTARVAEDAALGRMSRGDAMKAFSRFDELTTGGSFSNKARPSATSFSSQPAAGGLKANWGDQMRGSVGSFTNNASQAYSQAWWDRNRETFGHTGEGGARNVEGDGFYDPFGVNKQMVPEGAGVKQARTERVDSPLTDSLDPGGGGGVQEGDPFMAEEDGYMLALGARFRAGNDMLTRAASDAFSSLTLPYEEGSFA
jgi:hypothetical protein